MSIYLVIIPKSKSEVSVSEGLRELIDKVSKEYSRRVERFGYKFHSLDYLGSDYENVALVWDQLNPSDYFFKNKDLWVLTSGMALPGEIAQKVVRRGGRVQYADPVWGHYTVVRNELNMGQLQAWGTVPAIEGVNYGEDEDFIFISNRPFPIALALAKGVSKSIRLNYEFAIEYLAFGYSVTGNTGFEGVSILHPDKMMKVDNGKISFGESPLIANVGLLPGYSFEEGVDALLCALQNSMERAVKQLRGEKIQLRMSGGKDARLCAQLTKPYKNIFTGVTFGKPGELESSIAAIVSCNLGIELDITSPQAIPLPSFQERVERVLDLSDGILPSEPHTSIYEGANPASKAEGIMLGQWPLFKGGYAKRMRYSDHAVREKLQSIISPFVVGPGLKKYRAYIDSWLSSQGSQNTIEKLYLFSRQFRSGRWLQGNVALYSKDADVLYPLSDSEVASVSDALSIFDKVSQKTLFFVMERLDKRIARLPLGGDDWPFSLGEGRGEPAWYGLSDEQIVHAEVKRLVGSPNFKQVDYVESLSFNVISEISKLILCSDKIFYYKSILRDDFVIFMEKAAGGEVDIPDGNSLRACGSFLWRLYVLDVWFKQRWTLV